MTLAIAISIPPINTLIHGTHVVMAHGMGSELAIDSYILFAVMFFLFTDIFPKREVAERFLDTDTTRRTVNRLNWSLVVLVAWLALGGLVNGVTRYLGQPKPGWMEYFPYVFVTAGFTFAYFLLRLILSWLPLFIGASEHKTWYGDAERETT